MKVEVSSFLRAEDLNGATLENPVEVTVKELKLVPAQELAFPSDEDKYELTVELNGQPFDWLVNKTSLKAIITVYGSESDAWIGKKFSLFSTPQNVSGKMKQVIYAKV